MLERCNPIETGYRATALNTVCNGCLCDWCIRRHTRKCAIRTAVTAAAVAIITTQGPLTPQASRAVHVPLPITQESDSDEDSNAAPPQNEIYASDSDSDTDEDSTHGSDSSNSEGQEEKPPDDEYRDGDYNHCGECGKFRELVQAYCCGDTLCRSCLKPRRRCPAQRDRSAPE